MYKFIGDVDDYKYKCIVKGRYYRVNQIYKTMLNRLIDIMLLLQKEEPCLTAVRNVMARVVRFEYVYLS